jgi:hypothetical protein
LKIYLDLQRGTTYFAVMLALVADLYHRAAAINAGPVALCFTPALQNATDPGGTE